MLSTESVGSRFVEEEVVLLVELFMDEQSTSKAVQSTPLVSALGNSKHFLLIVSFGKAVPGGSIVVHVEKYQHKRRYLFYYNIN